MCSGEKTSLVSLDEVFAQLIEEQTKPSCCQCPKDYVFDVMDPPVAPEFKQAIPGADCVLALARDVCGGRTYSPLWKAIFRIGCPLRP